MKFLAEFWWTIVAIVLLWYFADLKNNSQTGGINPGSATDQ